MNKATMRLDLTLAQANEVRLAMECHRDELAKLADDITVRDQASEVAKKEAGQRILAVDMVLAQL